MNIIKCRRTFTALYAITCLTALGAYLRVDLSGSIALVAIALAGANSAQAVLASKKETK